MLQRIKCYNVLNVTSNEMLQSTKELGGSKIETFCPCSASRNFYIINPSFIFAEIYEKLHTILLGMTAI